MRDDFPPSLVLSKKYDGVEYKKFDNFNAINIDRSEDIPYDYDGIMGVPVTFLDKWNPEQFDVIGVAGAGGATEFNPIVEGKRKFRRILIKRK